MSTYSQNEKRAAKLLKRNHGIKHMAALEMIAEAKKAPTFGEHLAEARARGMKTPERLAYATLMVINPGGAA